MQRFNIFKPKTDKGADRHSKEIKFEQLLSGMGFRPENIHYAKTSLHGGFPEKAWYFPRQDDDRESLAMVALYEDGSVILREYQADGSKPEKSWNLCNLNYTDVNQTALKVKNFLEIQRLSFSGGKNNVKDKKRNA